MKQKILILLLFAFLLSMNSCVGDREGKLWNTLPGTSPVPVLIRTSGKITFHKSKDSDVATIICPKWPWYEMMIMWPEGIPHIDETNMEIMEEKWLGGGRQVVRVFLNGKTVYDGSICEKHHVPMVRLNAGKFDVGSNPARYLAVSQKTFPNDGMTYYLSGYGCESGLAKRVWRCPSCYESFIRWTATHTPK